MKTDCLHRMEVATMVSATGLDFHILNPRPSCVYVVYRIQKWPNLDDRVGCYQLLLASIGGK